MCLLQRKLDRTSQNYKMLQLLIGEIFLIDAVKCDEGFLRWGKQISHRKSIDILKFCKGGHIAGVTGT